MRDHLIEADYVQLIFLCHFYSDSLTQVVLLQELGYRSWALCVCIHSLGPLTNLLVNRLST